MADALISLASVCGLLLLSQLSPGPDVLFVFRSALAGGFRSGAAVGAGISTGFFIQAALGCTLGAWVVQQSWAQYVLYAALVWLLYLAWRIFPCRGAAGEGTALDAAVPTATNGAWRFFRQGFLCNILNPKCMLFICALVAVPLKTFAARFSWFAPALALAMTLVGQLGWMLWSALLQWQPIKGFYLRHVRGIDMLFSLLLAAFALLLLLR